MVSTTRLALFCLVVILSFPLCAQSVPPVSRHWQMSVGAQYAQGRKSNVYSTQSLDAFSFGGNLEYVFTLSKIKMACFMYVGFQQLRAEGTDVVAASFFGLEETLSIDNVIFGPGLEFKLNNKGKYHPFFGAQSYFGFSVSSEYDFQNTGMNEQYILPSAYRVTGGAGLYTGGQLFTGLERAFNEKNQLRIKAALGQHYQFASWQLPYPIYFVRSGKNAQLVRGGYWQASVEVIHRL